MENIDLIELLEQVYSAGYYASLSFEELHENITLHYALSEKERNQIIRKMEAQSLVIAITYNDARAFKLRHDIAKAFTK